MRGGWLRHQTYRRVLVSTTDDQTFDGLLAVEARDGLVLRSASLIVDGRAPIAISGEAFIPRERVLLVQFPHPDTA